MNFTSLLDLPSLLMLVAMTGMRTLVAFSMLPMFAASSVPTPVRLGIGVAIVVPVVAARFELPLPVALETWPMLMHLFREAGIGIVIGLGFGAFTTVFQMAGDIIDHQNGLTFTQNIDATFGNTVSVTAHLFDRVLFAALMSAGFLLIIADALYLSYEIWPVGQPLPTFERAVPLTLIAQSGRLLSLALLLAGPVLLVLFVVDMSLGMLNRAAPQLGVFQLGLAIKPIAGLFVIAMALPLIIQQSLIALVDFAATVRALIMFRS